MRHPAIWLWASGARFSSHHCKAGCSTRHALPSPANDQCHHQPYQFLRAGRILAKISQACASIVRLPVDWNLVVLKIAIATSSTATANSTAILLQNL
jgi:hypothetical protein